MSEDLRKTSARWLFRHDIGFKDIPPMAVFDAYAKAVLCCTNGDGKLAPEEREWVCGYFAALGAPAEFIDMLRNYKADEDPSALAASSEAVNANRRSLIFDAIRASSADGEFHPQERAAVEKVAATLGVSKEEVAAIEKAYNDEVHAVDARRKLIFPQGIPF